MDNLRGQALSPRRLIAAALLGVAVACDRPSDGELPATEKKAIADSLTRLVVSAYDLSKPDPVSSLMSLYSDADSLVSASGGGMVRTRAQLEQQIKTFWNYVGTNMQKPRWEWTSMAIDVLSPDAAVMTSTYRIPHLTPQGRPHSLGGAWTAVFARRGGRWVIVQEHLSDVPSSPQ
jgi:ketosteroid isomerase-like protein